MLIKSKETEIELTLELDGILYDRTHRYSKEKQTEVIDWFAEDDCGTVLDSKTRKEKKIQVFCDVNLDLMRKLETKYNQDSSAFNILNQYIETTYRILDGSIIYIRTEMYNVIKDTIKIHWFCNGYDPVSFEEGYLNDNKDKFCEYMKTLESKFQAAQSSIHN